MGLLVNGLVPLAGSAGDRDHGHRKTLASTELSTLSAGDFSGTVYDWWIVLVTPFGNFWIDPTGWELSEVPLSLGQIPLFDLPAIPLLETPLPPGIYGLIFILDDNLNGILDAAAWFDIVVVDVSS